VDGPSKQGGEEIVEFGNDDIKMAFDRGKVTTIFGGDVGRDGYYLLGPNGGITSIEMFRGTKRSVMLTLGIYRFEDRKLTLCLDRGSRPPSFTPGLGSSAKVLTFKRQKRRP
jgi:hypothetical protein